MEENNLLQTMRNSTRSGQGRGRPHRPIAKDLQSQHVSAYGRMESTGIYWRPVFAVLEGYFDIIVGNAWHIRNVPGRKTDVKDVEWIADLVRHGLVSKSFVPPRPLRELGELLR